MPLALLCDEHIPYAVTDELKRRGLDVLTCQEIGLRSEADEAILATARELRRTVYTRDDDYLRLHAVGVLHEGILYHHQSKYSIGNAVEAVAIACSVLNQDEMRNNVEHL